jgi:peptidoglycan hydrolase-like protein with peptidoglycan-binding domain
MSHYDHVGAVYHAALGETFTPSTVTLVDVRAGTSIISRGAKSDAVKQLQAMLNALKFFDSKGKPLAVDGMLGPLTQTSLKAAQAAIKARVPSTVMLEGVLDKPTLLALDALRAGQPLPGESISTSAVSPELPRTPDTIEGPRAWWKSPAVLGIGALAVVAIVAAAASDQKAKRGA